MSARWRQCITTGLIVFALAAAIVGFYTWRVARRQQLLIELEESGAEILARKLVDSSRSISNPGWLVRSAESVHQITGIGKPQQIVRTIRAEGSRFHERHFRYLSEARELKHLYAMGSGITDDHVSGLAALEDLRTVDLSCTRVTDRALEHLAQCPSLRKLMVHETLISLSAIETFRDQRPDVTVHWTAFQSEERRQTISQFITCGGQVRFRNRSSWGRGGVSANTAMVRGRWTRNVDHDEQIECLQLAASLKDISTLWMHGLSLGPAEFEVLANFAHVRALRLDRMRTRDFHWLDSFTSLDSITFAGRVSAEWVLPHACKLPNLRSVVGENVNDRAAEFIGLADQLETIWLDSTTITDAAIVQWAHLTRLQRLLLDSPHITDKSLPTIAGFVRLNRLGLSGSQITDEALAHLQPLTNLRMLDLSDTLVTPAGFVHLVPLVRLDQLRWQARPSQHDQTDLLDTIMNSFWFELASRTDDRLKTMFLEFVADLPKEEYFALDGHRVDISQPDQWIDHLLQLLQPVRAFRTAVPECELR